MKLFKNWLVQRLGGDHAFQLARWRLNYEWLRAQNTELKGQAEAAKAETVRQMKEIESLRARLSPAAVFADDEPQWTPEIAEAWKVFLGTHASGMALQQMGNFREQHWNRWAVNQRGNEAFAAGFARGFGAATDFYFHELLSAQARPQQGTDTQASDDADALRERLAS